MQACCGNMVVVRGSSAKLRRMNLLLPLLAAMAPAPAATQPTPLPDSTLALIRGAPIIEFVIGDEGRQRTVQIWSDASQAHVGSNRIVAHLMTRTAAGLTVQITDDTQCPALEQVRQSLTLLPLPTLALTGTSATAIFTEGNTSTYTLKANALYDGAPSTIQVSAGDNTPLAEWVTTNMTALAPCFPRR